MEKRPKFFINDHVDILIEILKRLDGQSLGVAACVCRLWCSISRNDSLWEHLCFGQLHVNHQQQLSRNVRPVVLALGGYKRLYMVCLRPVLSRLGGRRWLMRSAAREQEVQLMSLSLFCVDYYERLLVVNPTTTTVTTATRTSTSSLMFLNNNNSNNPYYPINV